MKRIIGTCSLCGGPVSTYDVWGGILPPPVTCEHCGAQQSHGPVIPMTPRPVQPNYPFFGGGGTTGGFPGPVTVMSRTIPVMGAAGNPIDTAAAAPGSGHCSLGGCF